MPPVIDAVPIGTATNNSYVTIAEADAFWETQLRADVWTNASDDDKAKALIMATSRLDQEKYYGERKNTDQSLSFPRINLPLLDGIDVNNIIPIQIKEGTYYLSIYMLSNDMSQKEVLNQTTKKEKVGSLEVEYATNQSGSFTTYSDDLPSFVQSLLSDLSRTASNTYIFSVGR